MKKQFEGKKLSEVFDFRLSNATVTLNNSGKTWTVEVFAKSNPDYNSNNPESLAQPLEVHDTGIEVTPNDTHDVEKIKACYEWIYSIRDKYSLDNIEELKPLVADINKANQAYSKAVGAV